MAWNSLCNWEWPWMFEPPVSKCPDMQCPVCECRQALYNHTLQNCLILIFSMYLFRMCQFMHATVQDIYSILTISGGQRTMYRCQFFLLSCGLKAPNSGYQMWRQATSPLNYHASLKNTLILFSLHFKNSTFCIILCVWMCVCAPSRYMGLNIKRCYWINQT